MHVVWVDLFALVSDYCFCLENAPRILMGFILLSRDQRYMYN